MVAIFWSIALINLVGLVICHSVARNRGSRRVVFWTTMGAFFGPLAIPFVLKFTRSSVTNTADSITAPYPGEIEEAKSSPNGWVYRIDGRFSPHEAVPPEAIVGAWKVDENGSISGNFVPNPNYKPRR